MTYFLIHAHIRARTEKAEETSLHILSCWSDFLGLTTPNFTKEQLRRRWRRNRMEKVSPIQELGQVWVSVGFSDWWQRPACPVGKWRDVGQSWVKEDPCQRAWQPLVFLLKSRTGLMGYSHESQESGTAEGNCPHECGKDLKLKSRSLGWFLHGLPQDQENIMLSAI